MDDVDSYLQQTIKHYIPQLTVCYSSKTNDCFLSPTHLLSHSRDFRCFVHLTNRKPLILTNPQLHVIKTLSVHTMLPVYSPNFPPCSSFFAKLLLTISLSLSAHAHTASSLTDPPALHFRCSFMPPDVCAGNMPFALLSFIFIGVSKMLLWKEKRIQTIWRSLAYIAWTQDNLLTFGDLFMEL